MNSQPPRSTSRRDFLRGAVGLAAVAGGLGRATGADDKRARALALLDANLAVDIHSHAGGLTSASGKTTNLGASIRSSHLSAICLALASDKPVTDHDSKHIFATRAPHPGELHDYTLNRLDLLDRMLAEFKIARVLNLADLRAAKGRGQPGVIVATEGSDFLEGKIDNLDLAYRRGVRHWQLVHYRADNGLGDIQTERAGYGGATPFGLEVVRNCNRLGIVVDVAHATFETVKQVVAAASAPLVLSHTAYSVLPRVGSRLINTNHAKLVAETGGVVGVWSGFSNISAYADGVARLADQVGVDHVAIGTDLAGLLTPLLHSYAEFPDVVAALFDHFNDEEVKKIVGGNYLRVFERVTKTT